MTDWPRVRLDWVASEKRRVVDPQSVGVDSVFLYSIPILDETGDGQLTPVWTIGSGKILLSGDEVLISKLNPRKSRVVCVQSHSSPMMCSTEFVVLRPARVGRAYLHYFLQSEEVRQCLEANTQSVTKSQQRANPEDVTKLWLRLPCMDAQRAIADFLDRETARIDSLIAAKRRMIELLREHYRSLLDAIFALPDVPRVPLGRFVVSFTQGRSPQAEDRTPNPGEWGVLKLSAVKVGKFEPNESKWSFALSGAGLALAPSVC